MFVEEEEEEVRSEVFVPSKPGTSSQPSRPSVFLVKPSEEDTDNLLSEEVWERCLNKQPILPMNGGKSIGRTKGMKRL